MRRSTASAYSASVPTPIASTDQGGHERERPLGSPPRPRARAARRRRRPAAGRAPCSPSSVARPGKARRRDSARRGDAVEQTERADRGAGRAQGIARMRAARGSSRTLPPSQRNWDPAAHDEMRRRCFQAYAVAVRGRDSRIRNYISGGGTVNDRAAGVVPGGIDPRALPDLRSARIRRTGRRHRHRRVRASRAELGVPHRRRPLRLSLAIAVLIARVETAKGWIFIALASAAAVRGDVPQRGAAGSRAPPDRGGRREHRRRRAAPRPRPPRRLRQSGGGAHAPLPAREADRDERRRVLAPVPRRLPERRHGPARAATSRSACSRRGGRCITRRSLHPPGGSDAVISVTAAGVRLQVGEPADVGRQRHARHHRHRSPGAAARSVLRRGRAFAEDAGRHHQGGRAGAAAGRGDRSSAAWRPRSRGSATGSTGWCRTCSCCRARARARWSCTRARWSCARCMERIAREARLVVPARGPHRGDGLAVDPRRRANGSRW